MEGQLGCSIGEGLDLAGLAPGAFRRDAHRLPVPEKPQHNAHCRDVGLAAVEGDVAQGVQDPGERCVLVELHLGQAVDRAVDGNADQEGV